MNMCCKIILGKICVRRPSPYSYTSLIGSHHPSRSHSWSHSLSKLEKFTCLWTTQRFNTYWKKRHEKMMEFACPPPKHSSLGITVSQGWIRWLSFCTYQEMQQPHIDSTHRLTKQIKTQQTSTADKLLINYWQTSKSNFDQTTRKQLANFEVTWSISGI